MLNTLDAASLRDRFLAVDYTVDGVLAAIGDQAQAALGRNSTLPAVRVLGGRDDPLATLTRLWPLQRLVPREALERALPGLVEPLLAAGVLAAERGRVRALLDLRPYAADEEPIWIVADLTPGLDTVSAPIRPDYVLGVSSASATLAQLTPRTPVRSALDLGTGCGVQAVHLAGHAERIVATDVNPRALELARLTFALNEVTVDVQLGSLYEPVAGRRFDLVVSNPPYVMAPPTSDAARLAYREGDRPADQLVAQLVREAAGVLEEGGTCVLLANWAHVREQPWTDRLHEWITSSGCDAHVVQREVLDPYAYAELWLADAGLAGTPDYLRRYAEWLSYFDTLGVTAVGLGWIVLHHLGRQDPAIRIEDWPYAVQQPLGAIFATEREALDLDRRLSDSELLAARWRVADDVVEEATGRPGAADPEHLVLRQRRGFCRAVEADTGLAAVVGACDGELPLGVLITAVAALLDVGEAALTAEVLPRFRELLRDGLVSPAF